MSKFFLSVFVFILLSGCHSSGSLQKETIAINKSYQPILLLPFVVSGNEVTSSDATSRDKGEAKLAKYLDNKYGWYTYSFDDKDFKVLHDSIFFSLYGDVKQKITADNLSKPSSGNFNLKLEFSEFGVVADGKTSKCILKGRFFLNEQSGALLKTNNFNIEYESAWSVAASKDGAVKALLKSLNVFLQN